MPLGRSDNEGGLGTVLIHLLPDLVNHDGLALRYDQVILVNLQGLVYEVNLTRLRRQFKNLPPLCGQALEHVQLEVIPDMQSLLAFPRGTDDQVIINDQIIWFFCFLLALLV